VESETSCYFSCEDGVQRQLQQLRDEQRRFAELAAFCFSLFCPKSRQLRKPSFVGGKRRRRRRVNGTH